jgi:hypothetical protein
MKPGIMTDQQKTIPTLADLRAHRDEMLAFVAA